jgi:hypothetical protein
MKPITTRLAQSTDLRTGACGSRPGRLQGEADVRRMYAARPASIGQHGRQLDVEESRGSLCYGVAGPSVCRPLRRGDVPNRLRLRVALRAVASSCLKQSRAVSAATYQPSRRAGASCGGY